MQQILTAPLLQYWESSYVMGTRAFPEILCLPPSLLQFPNLQSGEGNRTCLTALGCLAWGKSSIIEVTMKMVMKKKPMLGLRETVGQGSKFGATFRGVESGGVAFGAFCCCHHGKNRPSCFI